VALLLGAEGPALGPLARGLCLKAGRRPLHRVVDPVVEADGLSSASASALGGRAMNFWLEYKLNS